MVPILWGKYAPKTPQTGRELAISSQNAEKLKSPYLQNYRSDQDQISGARRDQQLHLQGGLILPAVRSPCDS